MREKREQKVKNGRKKGKRFKKIFVCVCEDNLVISFCLIWKFSLTKDIKCNFLFNEDKVKKND